MNRKGNGEIRAGLGLPTILFVVFLVLKLCKVITWSWIWVFAPLWISFIIGVLVFLLVFVVIGSCK